MYRVGILGTENSHAKTFTSVINAENSAYPDFEVVALYALELQPSEAIASNYPNIKICTSIEEMVDMVDCAMITARHGKYHKDFAMPFIKAGKPVFIDKPFAITMEDVNEILDTAEEYNVPVMGGSGCKLSLSLLGLKTEMESGAIGAVKNAVVSFPCDVNSVYGGMYFYGSHLVEMVLTLFGYDPISVTAFINNDFLSAVMHYEKLDVYLSFAKSYTAVVYGESGFIAREISISDIYGYEVEHFAEMVRSKSSSLSRKQLAKPIEVLNALEESLRTGTTVAI